MDDTAVVGETELREVIAEARRQANAEFVGNAWECGYSAGVAGKDMDGDLEFLEKTLGRRLGLEELFQYSRGFREGAIDLVRRAEELAEECPPDWTEIPL